MHAKLIVVSVLVAFTAAADPLHQRQEETTAPDLTATGTSAASTLLPTTGTDTMTMTDSTATGTSMSMSMGTETASDTTATDTSTGMDVCESAMTGEVTATNLLYNRAGEVTGSSLSVTMTSASECSSPSTMSDAMSTQSAVSMPSMNVGSMTSTKSLVVTATSTSGSSSASGSSRPTSNAADGRWPREIVYGVGSGVLAAAVGALGAGAALALV